MTEQPAENDKEKETLLRLRATEGQEEIEHGEFKVKPIKAKNKVGLVLMVLVMLAGLGGGGYWWYSNRPTTASSKPTAVRAEDFKPFFNPAYGRKIVVEANKETVGYVVDEAGTVMTVTFPKGAVKAKSEITLVPYGGGKTDGAFGAGVMIAPNQAFAKPITIAYMFDQSKVKVGAGEWRAFTYEEKANLQEPAMMVASSTKANLATVRTITGGAVFVGTNKAMALERAKQVLAKPKLSLFTLLSAATELLEQKSLPADSKDRVSGAVQKYINSNEPTLPELYTSVLLDKALAKSQSRWGVEKVYAQGADMSGYLEMRCKDRNLTVDDYLAAAQTAAALGHDAIADGCMDLVRELIDKEAKNILGKPNATAKEVLIVLQKALAVGVEDSLRDQLWEKARNIVQTEAEIVANNPEATDIDVAKVVQKMQALGVEGETRNKLETRLQETVEKIDEEINQNQPTVEESFDIDDQAFLEDFDMTILGLAMAKMTGLDSFDEAGIKAWTDKLEEQAEGMKELSQALCEGIEAFSAEGLDPDTILGDLGETGSTGWRQECAKAEDGGEMDDLIRQLKDEGYNLADEVGDTQALEYEEYEEDDQGSYESEYQNGLYISDEEPSPSPESVEEEDGSTLMYESATPEPESETEPEE